MDWSKQMNHKSMKRMSKGSTYGNQNEVSATLHASEGKNKAP